MNAEAKLEVIGWLYIAAGLTAVITQAVGLFMSVSNSPVSIVVFGTDVSFLFIPLGAGLIWRKELCRWLAHISSLAFLYVFAGVTFLMVTHPLTGIAVEFTPARSSLFRSGDQVVLALFLLFVILPVFLWQLHALGSDSVRALTRRETEAG